MRTSRIIRYPIDIISVLVVLSTLSLQLLALDASLALVRGHSHFANASSGQSG